jgi:hypothetical protein
MNATLRLACRFAVATAYGLAFTIAVGFICQYFGHGARATRNIIPMSYFPAAMVGLVTAFLALVAFCLFVAGVVEAVFRQRKSQSDDRKQRM